MSDKNFISLSAAKIALAVKRMRAQSGDLGLLDSEPIAIVGMACRLPNGIENPQQFWKLLSEGRETIREMPLTRWRERPDLTPELRRGGYFEEVDKFDAEFFGITPREAECIDPQQRMVLEMTWAALIDAGIPPESLAGSAAGIFVALCNHDYARMQLNTVVHDGSYSGMGSAQCMASGRIAFLLDTHGPNLVIDTACSSSLVAAHLACQSLRSRESDVAIVSAANLKVLPDEVIAYSKWGMLASDGREKTFDASADGFVPGEGAGAIVLKRLADSLAAGDNIRAVIRGSAVNHDGRTTVLSAPSGPAQSSLIRTALKNAQVAPKDVTYIETHGTGTPLGDPIEVEALQSVYGVDDGESCPLGAVKTNIGHLEPVAGIAGLLKVVLALENDSIPRNLHNERMNPSIDLTNSRFCLPTQNLPWPRNSRPRIAALSSFGMSGTNAHFLIEEAPPAISTSVNSARTSHVLPLSAKTPESLQETAESYIKFLRESSSPTESICASVALHRSHLSHRLAVTGTSNSELAAKLESYRKGQTNAAGVWQGVCKSWQALQLAFVFSGQGSMWKGMGKSLLEQEPVARKTIEEIDEEFAPLAGWSILQVLKDGHEVRRTDIAQPLVFAIQMGLSAVLESRGIVPSAVVGHSCGEVAAAIVAGLLTLDDGVRLIYHRGRLMQQAGAEGRMLSVALTSREAEEFVQKYRGTVSIAAFNAPKVVVLSGPQSEMGTVQAALSEQGAFNQWLDVEYAFHSHQMEGAARELENIAEPIRVRQHHLPMFSTVLGGEVSPDQVTARYWAEGIRRPVLFHQAIDLMMSANNRMFVEIGPRPTLTRLISDCAGQRETVATILPAMIADQSADVALSRVTAASFSNGVDVNWRGIFLGRVPALPLPAYPWQRKKFWLEDSTAVGQATVTTNNGCRRDWWIGEAVASPFMEGKLRSVNIGTAEREWLADYRLGSATCVPLGFWLSLACTSALSAVPNKAVSLVDWILPASLDALPEKIQAYVAADDVTLAESRNEQWHTALTARIERSSRQRSATGREDWRRTCTRSVSPEVFYSQLEKFDLIYGPRFRPITKIWTGERAVLAHLEIASERGGDFASGPHPILVEGVLQAVCAALGDFSGNFYLPKSLGRFEFLSNTRKASVFATISKTDRDGFRANAIVADLDGNLCLAIDALEARRYELPASSPAQSEQALIQALSAELRGRLKTASGIERRHLLVEHVKACLRLSMDQSPAYQIDDGQPLHQLGLDSLMAVSLRNMLQVSLGRDLESTFAFEHSTVNAMVEYLENLLWFTSAPANIDSSDSVKEDIRL